jgi:hypothetical protein
LLSPLLLPPLPLPSLLHATLVAIAIDLFVAIAIAGLPPLLPLPLPSLLPLLSTPCHPFCQHHCLAVLALFLALHPHIPIAIAIAPLPLPTLSPTSLIAIAINHIVAIALFAIACPPPLLP